ncbi:TetR/AcrR family transcriptional regulator [Brucepastera parasyntrophica]|uniref:TetR/AcrR family transcriptional regulator n=1 Tax=Brucepastera parasyntrophica TaxID=2880008 RepID=UPI00210B9DF9|nr:TetR/AcrR family transcriptional regulator [Brucepastera parasyntrophica]ULQ59450.1 TetR/AcrR family transcriptional regulator [Brucepastera parasyntrophica]
MKENARDRILSAGKDEFLSKGFKDASLRTIADRAGVTTGAIYAHYPDKAALFRALVEPAASEFREGFIRAHERFKALPEAEQVEQMHGYTAGELHLLFDRIYGQFEAFRLIVCSSAGTEYEHYVESLVDMETEASAGFIKVMRRRGYSPRKLKTNLIHILSNAYISAVFETVAHGMSRKEAGEYVDHITAFFTAGWDVLLGFGVPAEDAPRHAASRK